MTEKLGALPGFKRFFQSGHGGDGDYGNETEQSNRLRRKSEASPMRHYDESAEEEDPFGIKSPRKGRASMAEEDHIDPVSQLWTIFRQGTILCHLINVYKSSFIPLQNIKETAEVLQNAKLAQKNVYHFLTSIKILMQTESESFPLRPEDLISVSEIFQNDNLDGFVKVLKMVNMLLDRIETSLAETPTGNEVATNWKRISTKSKARMSMDAKTNREKVVRELLETERKYADDLEFLFTYMRAIETQAVLPKHVITQIFSNLPHLVDFERKFLVMLEDCISRRYSEGSSSSNASASDDLLQKIGHLFQQNEKGLAVYGPFCANRTSSLDTFNDNKENLKPLSDLLDPESRMMDSYLIKPIQRICRYPLLLKEMIRFTNENDVAAISALKRGIESIEKTISEVNELIRKEENVHVFNELVNNIVSWKGLDWRRFGRLILHENGTIVRTDEREVKMFLFENVLVFCREISGKKSVEQKKRSLILRRTSNEESTKTKYEIKGVVVVDAIEGLALSSRNMKFEIKVFFKRSESGEMEGVVLRFVNEEQQKLWHRELDLLLDLFRRRSAPAHTQSNSSNSSIKKESRKMDRAEKFKSTAMATINSSPNISTYSSDLSNGEIMFSPITEIAPPLPTTRPSNDDDRDLSGSSGNFAPSGRRPLRPLDEQFINGLRSAPVGKPPRSQNLRANASATALAHFSPATSPTVEMPPMSAFSNTSQLSVASGNSKEKLDSTYESILDELENQLAESSISKGQSAVPTPPARRRGSKAAIELPPPLNNPRKDSLTSSSASAMLAAAESTHAQMKIKLHDNGDIYVMLVSSSVRYVELVSSVKDKIKRDTLKLRYQDEDGDYITIASDDDIQVAIRLASSGNSSSRKVLNLYVV